MNNLSAAEADDKTSIPTDLDDLRQGFLCKIMDISKNFFTHAISTFIFHPPLSTFSDTIKQFCNCSFGDADSLVSADANAYIYKPATLALDH